MAIMTWCNFGEIMNNTFDFSYFVPTPDTTANCALSRWNDGLMGLSDFLKTYMSTRQSLEFGFSRSLNIKEILNLNLAPNAAKDADGKNDYVINYRKFGDIKAYVCGFEIPIVDFMHPFLKMNWVHDRVSHIDYDTLSLNECVTHVFNYKSELDQPDRVDATIASLTSLRNDVENIMTDTEIATYFNKNFDGTAQTRASVLTMIDTAISTIQSMTSSAEDFIFGYGSKEDLEEINSDISGLYPSNSLSSTNLYLYRDLCYVARVGYPYKNFKLKIDSTESDYILSKYFHPNGIDLAFDDENSSPIITTGQIKKQILIFFRFNLTEKPTITPFISHDGTEVPLSKQNVTLRYSKHQSGQYYNGMYQVPSYWDSDLECPVYFDSDGIARPMTLESNVDGMGGKDYTFWSSPVQKTDSGYQFECCMPLVFYNEVTNSYGNEYYATKPHDGIEVGQVMYRIPVVKRMRQNIEEAVVNTHLAKCLNDLIPATDENAEDDETVVLGGVVVDDFTEGLYPVAETQKVATEREYGEVKITKVKDSDGEYNETLNLMYHYSETGELSYGGYTMPDTGRAIDMITLFDTLQELGGGAPIEHSPYFVVNGVNNGDVNIFAQNNNYASLYLKSDFCILMENSYSGVDFNYENHIYMNEDGSISLTGTDGDTRSSLNIETSYAYLQTSPVLNSSNNRSEVLTDLDFIRLESKKVQNNYSVDNKILISKLDNSNNNKGINLQSQKVLPDSSVFTSSISLKESLTLYEEGTANVPSYIILSDGINIRSEGDINETSGQEYIYSIMLESEYGNIIMGKTGENNVISTWNGDEAADIITLNIADATDTASESIYLCDDSPTWSVYLKRQSDECRIFFQKTSNKWNLSPANNSNDDPVYYDCDLGRNGSPWKTVYAKEVSSKKIITNDGITTSLDNTGVFNMHPRLGNSNDTLTIPIGGIIAVNARGLKEANLNALNAGNTVQITSAMSVMVAKFKGTSIMEGSYKIGNGQYVLLNDYDAMYDYPNHVDTLVLLLRVV